MLDYRRNEIENLQKQMKKLENEKNQLQNENENLEDHYNKIINELQNENVDVQLSPFDQLIKDFKTYVLNQDPNVNIDHYINDFKEYLANLFNNYKSKIEEANKIYGSNTFNDYTAYNLMKTDMIKTSDEVKKIMQYIILSRTSSEKQAALIINDETIPEKYNNIKNNITIPSSFDMKNIVELVKQIEKNI